MQIIEKQNDDESSVKSNGILRRGRHSFEGCFVMHGCLTELDDKETETYICLREQKHIYAYRIR